MADETVQVTLKLRDHLTAGMKKAQATVTWFANKTRTVLASVRASVFSLKGAFLGIGGGLLAKSFIDAASEAETFRSQLKAIYNQNEQLADQTLKWVRDFAANTAHSTSDVVQSFVMLKAAGINVTKDMLSTIGDAAYLFRQNIVDLSSALLSLEAEPLRKLGINLVQTGKLATISFDGMTKSVEKSRDTIRDTILDLLENKFGGAMKNAGNDWANLTALLGSQWWEFRAKVMGAGVFEYLKASILEASGAMEDMDKAAPEIAESIISKFKLVARVFGLVADGAKVIEAAFYGIGIAAQMMARRVASDMKIVVDIGKAMSEPGVIPWIPMLPQIHAGFVKIGDEIDRSIRGSEMSIKTLEDQINIVRNTGSEYEKINDWLDAIDKRLAKVKAKQKEMQKSAGAAQVKYRPEDFEGFEKAGLAVIDIQEQRIDLNEVILSQTQKEIDAQNQLMASLQGVTLAIEDAFIDQGIKAMEGLIDRTYDWKQALSELAADMARMAAKQVLKSVFSLAVTGIATGGETFVAAKGGVFNSFEQRIPIKGYASGGVTQGPELAIIGEGRDQEAVLPLKRGADGKLGVRTSGGGGGTVNITINAMDAKGVNDFVNQHSDIFAGATVKAFRNGSLPIGR